MASKQEPAGAALGMVLSCPRPRAGAGWVSHVVEEWNVFTSQTYHSCGLVQKGIQNSKQNLSCFLTWLKRNIQLVQQASSLAALSSRLGPPSARQGAGRPCGFGPGHVARLPLPGDAEIRGDHVRGFHDCSQHMMSVYICSQQSEGALSPTWSRRMYCRVCGDPAPVLGHFYS